MPKYSTRNVNFIPEQTQQNTHLGNQFFRWVTNSGKIIIIVVDILIVVVFLARFKLDKDMSSLEKKTQEKALIVNTTSDIEAKHREVLPKLKLLETIMSQQIDWKSRLTKLQDEIPENVLITNMEFDNNNLSLTAEVKTAQDFGLFMNQLISDISVKSLVINTSELKPEDAIYEFSLSMELADSKLNKL